jgi:hypothetical protein
MTVKMTTTIASQALSYQRADGSPSQITVELGTPGPSNEGMRDWECPFQITGFGEPIKRTIFGIDSMQALVLALHVLPTQLNALAREDGGRFLDQSDLGLDHACRVHLDEAG